MHRDNKTTAALLHALYKYAGRKMNPVVFEYFNPEMVQKCMNVAVLHHDHDLYAYHDVTKLVPNVEPSKVVALSHKGVRWFWVAYEHEQNKTTTLIIDYLIIDEYIAAHP